MLKLFNTSMITTMKNITSMKNEWAFMLSFGLIMLLLIGVLYNTSIAILWTGESKKIPLYYISTRDPQNLAYTVVMGPGYDNDTYRNFSEITVRPGKL